jgi:hypothetical protein
MMNCNPINSAKAGTPSASDTSLDGSTVARVEPIATVTTRSKAFIYDKVRLPEIRNNSTRNEYAKVPMTRMRSKSDQP